MCMVLPLKVMEALVLVDVLLGSIGLFMSAPLLTLPSRTALQSSRTEPEEAISFMQAEAKVP